jgi:hypothetical protein
MSVTFDVSDVKTEREFFYTLTAKGCLESLTNTRVEAYGSNVKNKLISSTENQAVNGFFQTINLAYSYHLPLVLSPDNVWLAISQAFAIHVNQHAEELRSLFVSHQGKKTILIEENSFIKGSPYNNWPGTFSSFSKEITNHIGEETAKLITSDFSTTGPVEKTISEIVLMDTVQHYFDYVVRTLCGIPKITLLGTLSDWESIKQRAIQLEKFQCQEWIDALCPVLDQFIQAFKGNVSVDFWKSIYKESGGSGGPFITGAISVFFPYLNVPNTNIYSSKNLNNWKSSCVTSDTIPTGISKVPFIWQYYAQTFPMDFLGGFIGTEQDPDSLSIKPVMGWGIADRVE